MTERKQLAEGEPRVLLSVHGVVHRVTGAALAGGDDAANLEKLGGVRHIHIIPRPGPLRNRLECEEDHINDRLERAVGLCAVRATGRPQLVAMCVLEFDAESRAGFVAPCDHDLERDDSTFEPPDRHPWPTALDVEQPDSPQRE